MRFMYFNWLKERMPGEKKVRHWVVYSPNIFVFQCRIQITQDCFDIAELRTSKLPDRIISKKNRMFSNFRIFSL